MLATPRLSFSIESPDAAALREPPYKRAIEDFVGRVSSAVHSSIHIAREQTRPLQANRLGQLPSIVVAYGEENLAMFGGDRRHFKKTRRLYEDLAEAMPEWVRGAAGRMVFDRQKAANGEGLAEDYHRSAVREVTPGTDRVREITH